MNFDRLPNEILLEIFKYCDIRSLLTITSSCRRFREIYVCFEEILLGQYIMFDIANTYKYKMMEHINYINHGICDSGILLGNRLDRTGIKYYCKGKLSSRYPVRNASRYSETVDRFTYKFTIQNYLLHGDFVLYNNNGGFYINIIHYNDGVVIYTVVINMDRKKIYIGTNVFIRYYIVDIVGIESDILSLQGKTGICQITLDGKNYNIDNSTARTKRQLLYR